MTDQNVSDVQCVLPNGLQIYHLHEHETTFLYDEIFRKELYFSKDITLSSDMCVVDVGANIGLFSLYILTKCPRATIYAIEPIPEIFDILELNLKIANPLATQIEPHSIHLLNCGVGAKNQLMKFVYYPHYSIISGKEFDQNETISLLTTSIQNQLLENRDPSIPIHLQHSSEKLAREVAEKKLAHRQVATCSVETLSQIFLQEGLTHIDLLKIDIEGEELSALEGIHNEDWDKIAQIIVEAHSTELCNLVEQKLLEKGYTCKVNQEKQIVGTGLYLIFASRDSKS